MIREKSHSTILPLDSRNQESAPFYFGAMGFFSDQNETRKTARLETPKFSKV